MKSLLQQVVAGQNLSQGQAQEAFEQIMAGQVEPAMMGAFLAALAAKGETAEELVGAAKAMRRRATHIQCAADAVDTCGTGGDGISTFNVSTTAAIIAAAAGVTVAKHGNRTNTRVSGSAEVLESLGVNIDADVPTVERCLKEVGIGFLYARKLHPAMKFAAGVRASLGIRTIFNLLGPLVNPAGVRRQVIGVPKPQWTELLATVLGELDAHRAWVVHGQDGLCDLTITGPTQVTELADGLQRTFTVSPGECGLDQAPLESLYVDSVSASAEVIRRVLAGQPGPQRDHALLNTGAIICVAGLADDLPTAVKRAAEAIDNGSAAKTLQTLVERSRGS